MSIICQITTANITEIVSKIPKISEFSNIIRQTHKMPPPTHDLSNTQVWEIKLVNDGQRKFIKSLDTTGGEQIY